MSHESLRKDLSDRIAQQFTDWSLQDEFSFLNPDAAQRVIGFEEGPRGLILNLASDGLTLDHKVLLEQRLKTSYGEGADSFSVNFKRLKSLQGRITNPKTADAPSARKPFGIAQRLKPIPGVKRVIAVSSGKGGVGKSTVSVNLAAGLAAEGQKVGLLDADLYGPSAALLLGLEGPMPVNAQQQMVPLEKWGVKVVSFGFMTDPFTPVIWRGPMVTKALEQLFYQVEWGELDTLIIDLPPGTGDVQLTMIEQVPLHGGIVVSTPQAVALLDAHKGLSMFEKLNVPVLGLVENMSHFQCGVCGHQEDIFGQAQIEGFAAERRVPIIARIPLHRRIREASDEGRPAILSDPELGQYYLPLVDAVLEQSAENRQNP